MVHSLRREFVYSEKRARDILFQEIEAILREGRPPMTVSRLTREAAARARKRARQAGYEFSNWDTACKATINAMLAAGALLSHEGRPIPLSVAAQAADVAGLAGDYVDITEAYLLEVLIRRLGDVTARDHTALAHALFRQFDPSVPIEDLEDRVVMLLATLSNRVVLAEGGTYCILDDAAGPDHSVAVGAE
jgi:hypothetical protein